MPNIVLILFIDINYREFNIFGRIPTDTIILFEFENASRIEREFTIRILFRKFQHKNISCFKIRSLLVNGLTNYTS